VYGVYPALVPTIGPTSTVVAVLCFRIFIRRPQK
jgi:hypothetical protein